MEYNAEISVKFIISDDSGANDEEIVEKFLQKAERFRHYLKFTAGPWKDVRDVHIDGIYDKENRLIWYE